MRDMDRREFLKGVVATWAATQVPVVVPGLELYECQYLFPKSPVPGTTFEIMVKAGRHIAWPSNIRWPSGEPLPLSGGTDIFHFFTPDGKEWFGTGVLDLR